MEDLVARLRYQSYTFELYKEAANEIDRLRAENAKFRAALFSSNADLPNPPGELASSRGPEVIDG